MSSLLTNTSAMSALQSLTATQKTLGKTQNEISTGERVSSASDNAAYWSIATKMRSDTGALSAVTDALSLGSSTIGVATAAMGSVLTALNSMKNDLVTAQTAGTDRNDIETSIASLQTNLISIASSASFNGVNLLDGSTNGATSIVSSFARDSTGTTSIGTITLDTTATTLTSSIGVLGTAIATSTATGTAGTAGQPGGDFDATSLLGFKIDTNTTGDDLATLEQAVEEAINAVTAASSTLGATKTNIDNQSTFVSALSDAITSGVGSLVDADMNVASTKLQALQTQQQLGVQALSIANQNSSLILKLFNG